MLKFGGWDINVPHDIYPQKVASAIGNLNELIGLGCDYKAIAYVGRQEVNGIGHAILAQQTVLNGKDVNNAVVIVLNEKHGADDLAVTDIRRVVEGGGTLGGIKVEMSTTIPDDVMKAFEEVTHGFVGSNIKPFAYVGSQVVKGTNYVLAAEVASVVPNATPDAELVTFNPMEGKMRFERMFEIGSNDSAEELMRCGYAFTWLKLGTPLGEWP